MAGSFGIGIIGGGNMGEALIRGLLSAYKPTDIMVNDISRGRMKFLHEKYRIRPLSSVAELARGSSVIILAVKPQQTDNVLSDIAAFLTPRKLIISVAAGIKTERIEKAAGGKIPVIRSMPNMPALIAKGISAVCRGRFAKGADIKFAVKILSSVGKVIEVKEEMMDVVTAVSGSGPAYFFYLIQLLTEAAVENGLSEYAAKELASQTAFGAVSMILETQQDPATLRQKVTSKGGTTQAAFSVFEKEGLARVVKKAIEAAIKRSEELSCL
jgi:pyrroline-5-carboxylate reductase